MIYYFLCKNCFYLARQNFIFDFKGSKTQMSHLRPAWPTFRVPDIKRRKFPRNKRYPICQNCTTSSPYIILCVVELHENHSTMSKERRKHIYIFFHGKFPVLAGPSIFLNVSFWPTVSKDFCTWDIYHIIYQCILNQVQVTLLHFVQINSSECCCLHSVYLYMK